jgi:hypothetical protein
MRRLIFRAVAGAGVLASTLALLAGPASAHQRDTTGPT